MDVRYIEYRKNDLNEQTYLIIISINGRDINTIEMDKNELNSFYKKIFSINEEIKKNN